MSRRADMLRVPFILVTLTAAIIAPIVASGYSDVRKADELKRSGEVPLAAQYYERAARKLPWIPSLWVSAASSYGIAGNCARAIPLFGLGKKLGLLTGGNWLAFGTCYAQERRYEEAVDTWGEGLRHDPEEAAFHYWLGWDAQRRDDLAAETEQLGLWVASGHAEAFSHYRLGELLMASEPDRARAELMQAEDMEPGYAPVVDTLDAALDLAAQQTDESARMVVTGRGLALVSQWPLAQHHFQEAVDADPGNAEAWAWLGEALQQNESDGKAALDQAVALDPRSALAHGLRGLYFKRQANYRAALAEYEAAAALEPRSADWQAALGDAYTSTGDLVSALAAYQAATVLRPGEATYWRLLALFSADNGVQVTDIGLPAAKRAAELAPDDAQVLDALGWAYAQAGLLSSAEQTLKKAIDLQGSSAMGASAHLHLALTYLKQGNQNAALSELRATRGLDPRGAAGAYAAQLLEQYFP